MTQIVRVAAAQCTWCWVSGSSTRTCMRGFRACYVQASTLQGRKLKPSSLFNDIIFSLAFST